MNSADCAVRKKYSVRIVPIDMILVSDRALHWRRVFFEAMKTILQSSRGSYKTLFRFVKLHVLKQINVMRVKVW